MRKALVNCKGILAGTLEEKTTGFQFEYDDKYLTSSINKAISLTMPKTQKIYENRLLFSVFYNMLPEGTNKELLCRILRIDEQDSFGLLLAVAQYDTIGALTISPIYDSN